MVKGEVPWTTSSWRFLIGGASSSEEVYLKASTRDLSPRPESGINAYLEFYNRQRPQPGFGLLRTPAEGGQGQHGQERKGAAAEEAGLLHRAW